MLSTYNVDWSAIMENTPLETLFTSDIGLLSLFTIGFVIAMAGYIGWFVHKNVINAKVPQEEKHDH
jgi:hypothetical protein